MILCPEGLYDLAGGFNPGNRTPSDEAPSQELKP
jgi:hypothetical protein